MSVAETLATAASPDTLDLLLTRRSVVAKNLGEPGPDAETLKKIIAAGLRVPDHGKIGPWRVQILLKDGQAALGDVFASAYLAENPDAEERMVEMERHRPQRSPVLLAVTSKIDPHHPKIPELEQRLSGGALCQNILVAAHASGFAAQWLTEWPAFHASVKEALGHSPETDIIGFIYIGTPTEAPTERGRPAYEDVVSAWTGPEPRA
ncbi:nitroreductase [Thalassobaculum sp. OXR-137]|uniref:nitroreductase family protein n=1 Tax=Thalassobaculum sp. OXR-137 TaxID=3100173 RepID=UPI002AC93D02|nr:nitroreductase [Thalassobaculum sp. OXR-137]WPZ35757.1 nitroreductase [Thalassobaculum sp. OXR-137]